MEEIELKHPGRLIALLPILALVPRLGLVVIAADRQEVNSEVRAELLWASSVALALLVGLSEMYVGLAVVSRRRAGLAVVWVGITVLLNLLVVPLSMSGLEAVPVWEILGTRALRVGWGLGLGLLSTLCVCGCLWADVIRDSSGLPKEYEAHLLSRIEQEERRCSALETEVSALRAQAERAASAAALASAPPPTHSGCELCGYWHSDQHKVAGHITQCRRKAARSRQSDSEPQRPARDKEAA